MMTMVMPRRDAQNIPAGEFKAKCLHLLDEVHLQRFQIVITKRGKPVARLVPVTEEAPDIFGRMKGSIEILGDIVGPTGEVWSAERDDEAGI
jgi:prevent-host-death family protein